MDEARVIPLHGAPSTRRPRARRLALRRADRPAPGPGGSSASVHHLLPVPARPVAPLLPGAERPAWEHRLAAGLTFLRRRLEGHYDVDEFGFDRDLTAHALLPVLEPLYRSWFRVEVGGIENVPAAGGALLVANHAGGLWPLDAAMTMLAVHAEHSAGRFLRPLSADLVFRLPVIGSLTRKAGGTLACDEDADRLLAAGELVGVWPEGFAGLGKPYSQRYRLQRFGHSAFVRAAVRAGVPIVPVSVIGAEETFPVLGNARPLARLLGLPHLPVTPTFPWLGPLGLVPLPSKWFIEFGAPILTDGVDRDAADDPAAMFELSDHVRETIQGNLFRLLAQRRSTWR